MANLLTLDFDDTIILGNSTRLVYERFAAPEWREVEASYHAGEMTVEQFNVRCFDLVETEAQQLTDAVLETAEVRDGLLELSDWVHWHDWQMVVVSNGFDFAVDAVLDRIGLDRVMRHAGRTRFSYRWRVRYDSPRGIEIEDGFKLSYAQAFRQAGDFVVYFGDGASDIPAAKLAPVVFARDTLLTRLAGTRDRVYAFESFRDAIAVLEAESDAWLASFSSTTAAGG